MGTKTELAKTLAATLFDDEGATNAGSALLYSGADRSVICRMVDPSGNTSDYLGRSAAAVGDQRRAADRAVRAPQFRAVHAVIRPGA